MSENALAVSVLIILIMDTMPRYDFQCEFCLTQVELTLAVDQQVPRCGTCRGLLKRLWSTVPIHFKGDGWAGKTK